MKSSLQDYRADIDGLRAIAVLSVVFFHIFPKAMPGGFIGVDIFFVISGYLISTIIFQQIDRGSFSFRDFYARRIRRIFPALLLVLIASLGFGYIALFSSEYQQIGKHVLSAATFVSNFAFWQETGYFDRAAEMKPLLNLWSLAIEEQFYILWPLLVWWVWRRNLNIVTLTAAVILLSFATNVMWVKRDFAMTFYMPLTRSWELLAGCLLAWCVLYEKDSLQTARERLGGWLSKLMYRKPSPELNERALRNAISFLGLILLAYGFWRINKAVSFPGKWAVFPVLGASFIILAGPSAWLNKNVLSNPIAVWFGLISYPLYLWHWPVLSFALISQESLNLNERLLLVAISILLAWLTYLFVESPIRKMGYGKIKVAILVALMAIVGIGGLVVYANKGFPNRFADLETKLSQLTWRQDQDHRKECIDKYGHHFFQYCLIEDVKKPPEIVLFGDSTANHLYEGLNAVTPGKNLLMIGRGACPPLVGVTVRLQDLELNCQTIIEPALKIIEENTTVKTVVISMMGAGYVANKKHYSGGMAYLHEVGTDIAVDHAKVFKDGLRNTLNRLLKSNKEIIFVISTPRLNFHTSQCVVTRPLTLKDKKIDDICAISVKAYLSDAKLYLDSVYEVLKDFPTVKIVDLPSVLCDAEYCHAMRDGVLLYKDDIHLSTAGSHYIGPFFKHLFD
jgi:peptidoglycan/LPS O-acetylase OafA/YrhL